MILKGFLNLPPGVRIKKIVFWTLMVALALIMWAVVKYRSGL